MSNEWMREFDQLNFKVPYAEEYVQHSVIVKRLKDVNLRFNLFYAENNKRSTTIVRFSDNVKEYYPI